MAYVRISVILPDPNIIGISERVPGRRRNGIMGMEVC